MLYSKDILLKTYCKTFNCGHPQPENFPLPNPNLRHNRAYNIVIIII